MEYACRLGDCARIQELLDEGADINAIFDNDNTVLHIAVKNNLISVVTLLVERGADIDARDWWGRTPLHHAIINGRAEIITYLLCQYADITITDIHQYTPLHFAVVFDNTPDIVTQLITAGASVDARHNHGRTALHSMFCRSNANNSWREITLILLSAKADIINAQDFEGFTILHHIVIITCDIDHVRLLLEHGASADIRNKVGKTALDLAKDEAIITLLRTHIASLDVKNAGRRK